MKAKLPRLMISGIGGDSGKTLVALGLAALWRREGLPVRVFKKGPDYIDPAWLTVASGRPARNLDTWMMGPPAVLHSFLNNSISDGINLLEGNRGLYDGEDAAGTHSSAELSKLLKTPVVLALPTVKVTRTAAALVLGLKKMDPDVEIAGVILNRVATSRQEAIIRTSVEESTGVPVIGSIPRISENLLPSRHLGLVIPEEHPQSQNIIKWASDIVERSVDVHQVRSIAESAALLEKPKPSVDSGRHTGARLRIGYFQSPAFTFYYPENLEAIDRCGAMRVPVDPLNDGNLPEIDALYIGGGFPESHAASLSDNGLFRVSVQKAAQSGLPIWAECGGLIFLCRSIYWKGNRYPMAGVFPADIVLGRRPAGHGYEEVLVDGSNPFLKAGTVLRGHEFHYSRLKDAQPLTTIFDVKRGSGVGNRRDGLIIKNVVATYLHLHVLGAEIWLSGFLSAAAAFAESRRKSRG
jgi:cobyrinic acid a,c-diamide synthase